MIKINIDNIGEIKANHKEYIKNNVENRLALYEIFSSEKIEIINFISKTLYKKLYEITLEEIDIDNLSHIIKQYNRIKYKKIIDEIKIDNANRILEELDRYLSFIKKSEGRGNSTGEERKVKWQELCNLIKNISEDKINIEKLVSVKINFKIKKEITSYLKKIINFLKYNLSKNDSGFYISLEDIIKNIFNYEYFVRNQGEWNRHKIMYMIGINVCPYCNRNYVTNYIEDGEERTTADLDHFYYKSEYPYLALSIYNFIPSCQICNSRFKLGVDFCAKQHIYPYKEKFGDDAVFRTTLNKNSDLDYLLGKGKNFDIKIKIDTTNEEKKIKIENSIETFRLEKLYNTEKDYVSELINKCNIYNKNEIKNIMKIDKLFDSEEQIKEFIFGKYLDEEKLHKRPLAKLTKDIYEEFNA